MKNFINIAKAEYTVNGQRKCALSNRWVIASGFEVNNICGKVICKDNFRPWIIRLINADNNRTVHTLRGVHSRSFSFTINPSCRYIVEFTGEHNCCMRLYNIPDAVCDVRWQDAD